MTRARVAVIGGGASGVLAAVNVSRALGDAGEVVIVERSDSPGRGIAYSTREPDHLLNVRVANMSAFPSDPDHFFRWLQQHGPEAGLGCPTHFCFVPRRTYGAYLADLLASVQMQNVRVVTGAAAALEQVPGGVMVRLADGGSLFADAAVLATGHDAKPAPAEGVVDAWTPGAARGLAPDAPVMVLGTGLTMIDTVLSLRAAGHRGRIIAMSRRGLAPQVHAAVPAMSIEAAAVPFGAPLSRLVGWLRATVRRAAAEGRDWRSVVDALRPHTRALWRAMDPEQRARFMRHARPWWDVHRHRMAPSVAEILANLAADGRLAVVAARVTGIARGPQGSEVSFRRRGVEGSETIHVARVIDATGLPSNPRRSPNPVIASLFEHGMARLDPLEIGLDLAEDYAVVDERGRASDRIFAVGPLGRGAFWEMIAIPDIRRQCADLADDLAARLGGKRQRLSA